MTVSQLRDQFPTFYYTSYRHHLSSEGLHIEFEFELDATHRFTPSLLLYDITRDHLEKLAPETLDSYVFHLGLVEMLSYWKTTCSPEIVVKAGCLDTTQVAWWHDLLIKGLGEFFYVNQIDFTAPDFVTIRSTQGEATTSSGAVPLKIPQVPDIKPDDTILIPVGGGKDSVVTLEVLKEWCPQPDQLTVLHLNPADANQDTAKASGLTQQLFVRRILDPQLAEMNADGFLNGHTPFSALLAFLSTMVAHLHGHRFVALSNERSSNEGNVVYQNVEVNHQYSKSFEFEQAFQAYLFQYFPESPWYFSLLRPWYELQIARQFALYPVYHSVFRSCNRGKKTNVWCGECSKCLFAYVILVPFIGATKAQEIFGKDILNDLDLLPVAQELVGYGIKKPLECVGTSEESLAAFYLSWQWYQSTSTTPPLLLKEIVGQILAREVKSELDHRAQAVLSAWNSAHALPTSLATFLERK